MKGAFDTLDFHGRIVFLRGGSGFLETGLAYKLALQSRCKQVIVLCRGGADRLFSRWLEELPRNVFFQVVYSGRILAVDGDITEAGLGLHPRVLASIQAELHIVIHARSSISLRAPLSRMVNSVIVDSCNTPFPWPYAYVKNLTERLLVHRFCEARDVMPGGRTPDNSFSFKGSKLLIIQPLVVGAASEYPAPGWQIATSTPSKMLALRLVLVYSKDLVFPSRFAQPEQESTIDEVPVDIVVNLILAHAAAGTAGIVHAVAGHGNGVPSVRKNVDWKSAQLSQVTRFYKILGASANFRQQQTENPWSSMSKGKKRRWPLFPFVGRSGLTKQNFAARENGLMKVLGDYFRSKGWPRSAVKLVLRSADVTEAGSSEPVHLSGLARCALGPMVFFLSLPMTCALCLIALVYVGFIKGHPSGF
ncbi:hypothetical protein CDD83_406 [Cordyceps sp. RAO-2017]|nr:hypothetical protein CDD83_406 [Cordyceps sp. RAO-2017]